MMQIYTHINITVNSVPYILQLKRQQYSWTGHWRKLSVIQETVDKSLQFAGTKT